jgi:hypothetical protein
MAQLLRLTQVLSPPARKEAHNERESAGGINMVRLISGIAAIVLATSTLVSAAPRHSVPGKTTTASRAKTMKAAKPAHRKARKAAPAKYRKATVAPKAVTTAPRPATTAQKPLVSAPKPAFTESIVTARHDVTAEEQELKRLKASVKTSQKAGDWRRASRDRREMYRLEADVRADKADMKEQQRSARSGGKKRSRIPFWGWWRS